MTTKRTLARLPNNATMPIVVPTQDDADIEVMHKWWRAAKLDVYQGRTRTWEEASFELRRVAYKVQIDDTILARTLVVIGPPTKKIIADLNAASIEESECTWRDLFVVGRMQEYRRDKAICALPAVDWVGKPKFLIKTEDLDQAFASNATLHSLFRDGIGECICLARVAPGFAQRLKIVEITLFQTDRNFVPISSMAEFEFQAYLESQNRRYIKLRSAPGDSSHGIISYILLDRSDRTKVVVLGAQTISCLEGIKALQQDAKEKGIALICWSANPPEPFPELPAPDRIANNAFINDRMQSSAARQRQLKARKQP